MYMQCMPYPTSAASYLKCFYFSAAYVLMCFNFIYVLLCFVLCFYMWFWSMIWCYVVLCIYLYSRFNFRAHVDLLSMYIYTDSKFKKKKFKKFTYLLTTTNMKSTYLFHANPSFPYRQRNYFTRNLLKRKVLKGLWFWNTILSQHFIEKNNCPESYIKMNNLTRQFSILLGSFQGEIWIKFE